MGTESITKPGYYDLPADVYHADPAPRPSLNAGVITRIVTGTLADARQAHPRLTPPDPEDGDDKKFDLGSVAHELLLGRGSGIEVIDEEDWRKKVAQEARKAAIEAGLQPCLRKTYEQAEAMVAALRGQLAGDPDNRDAFTDGRPEQVCLWQEETPHGKMWGRSMLDWQMSDRRRVYDYKTFKPGADPEGFVKYLVREGRDIQDPWYSRGVAALEGCDWSDIDFRFVVQSPDPPYLAAVIAIQERDWSNERVEWAIRKWADAAASGRWSGYAPCTHHVGIPAWAMMAWEDRMAADRAADQAVRELAA